MDFAVASAVKMAEKTKAPGIMPAEHTVMSRMKKNPPAPVKAALTAVWMFTAVRLVVPVRSVAPVRLVAPVLTAVV